MEEFTLKILALFFAILGGANIIMGYLVATDKKKPSKTAQVINYMLIAMFLLGYAVTVYYR